MQGGIVEKLSGSDNLLNRKPRLKILILGPYRPKAAKRRLVDIKEHLIKRGYVSTKLVEDFDNIPAKTEEEVFEKSRDFMKNWADVLFFFFFKESLEGMLMGVHDELAFLCERMPKKIDNSVVFIDESIYNQLSIMFKGRLQFFEMRADLIKKQEEAKKSAESYAFNFLTKAKKT